MQQFSTPGAGQDSGSQGLEDLEEEVGVVVRRLAIAKRRGDHHKHIVVVLELSEVLRLVRERVAVKDVTHGDDALVLPVRRHLAGDALAGLRL